MFQHLQCKQYTYQRGIKHSNNTADKKIGTIVWDSINRSPDLMTITDYSQNIIIYCEVCSCFQLFTCLHPVVISLGTRYSTVFTGALLYRITLQLCWVLIPTAAHNE
jgi:hypothetical protein